MAEIPEWITNEISRIAERGQDLPPGVITILSELLEQKLSADSIPKAELGKMADQLIAAMNEGISSGGVG